MTKNTPGPLQEKWIQELEQHPERQWIASLGYISKKGKMQLCCLGQGAVIAGLHSIDEVERSVYIDNKENRDFLPLEAAEKLGLRSGGGVFEKPVMVEGKLFNALYMLNDCKVDWPTIAKIMRDNFDNIFTKSV